MFAMLMPLLATLLMTVPVAARAAIDCWIEAEHPKTADGLAVGDPAVAGSRRTARAIHAILRRQPELAALPPTRLRSRWQIAGLWGGPARGLHYQLRDHRASMWGPGCSVRDGADRLEPQATVVATVNAPEALFQGAPVLRDEQLTAWPEPPVLGSVQGRPLYHGFQLALTSTGRVPWVNVTMAEYLDFAAREIDRRAAEVDAVTAKHGLPLDRHGQPLVPTPQQQIAQERARLEAFRAGLTPEQLAGPARHGWDGRHPDVPPERFPRIVKLDPAFPWDTKDRQRPQVIALTVIGNGPFEAPMKAVRETLDLAAFEALVRPGGGQARAASSAH